MLSNSEGNSPAPAGKLTLPIPGVGTVELNATLRTIVLFLGFIGLYWRPQWPQAAISLLLILASLVWSVVAYVRRPRSRLLQPAAPRKIHEAFVGREIETEDLSALVLEAPLVWVTGESGSGKSSLITKGVLPHLQKRSDCLMVYLEDWDADWIKGPTQRLSVELGRASSMDLGPNMDEVARVAHSLRASGRTIVLFFDQIDDYVVRNLQRFITRSGRAISAAALRKANSFWDAIAALISDGSVHCVLIARQDMQWGRASFHFQEPVEEFFLRRLGVDVVEQLLVDSIPDGAVSRPEISWHALRSQICRDLAERDGILPVQMKFVVESLFILKDDLSVRSYRQRGRASGLVAENLRVALAHVSRHAGGDEITWQRVLLRMTDGRKTTERTEEELARRFSESPLPPGNLRLGLEELKRREFLRDSARPGDRIPRWRLDHDYLVEAVKFLNEQQNPRQYELIESYERWAAIGSWLGAWVALLRSAQLLRILWARVRGRIHFGPYRQYLALSAVRALSIWTVVSVLVGLTGWQWFVGKETALHFQVIGLGEIPGRDEAQALWDLTREPYSVRAGLVKRFFDNPTNAARFDARPMNVLIAAAGANLAEWEKISADLRTERCQPAPEVDDNLAVACGVIWLYSNEPDRAAIFLSAVTTPARPPRIFAGLAMLLGMVARGQDAAQVADAMKRVLRDAKDQADPVSFGTDAIAALSLARALPGQRYPEFAKDVINILSDSQTDDDRRGVLLATLRAVATRMDEEQHSQLVSDVVQQILGQTLPPLDLLRALAEIANASDFARIRPVLDRLHGRLAVENDLWSFKANLDGLAILKSELSPAELLRVTA